LNEVISISPKTKFIWAVGIYPNAYNMQI